MADKDKHDPIGQIKDFCPVPGTPCKCPEANNYQDNCEPSWASGWRFAMGTTGKSEGGWQAHHVLSISCVNWLPDETEKREALQRVLEVTVWCINNKDNMLAMPMFGMTIMHYTDVMNDRYYIVDFPSPPFRNIPQHDFEHNTTGGYCTEVKDDIAALWGQIAKAAKKHIKSKSGIQGRLNTLSDKWQGILETRGMRLGGTHKGWKKGMASPESNWYLPFSMASDAHADTRYFPATGESWVDIVNEKMDDIRTAMGFAGTL